MPLTASEKLKYHLSETIDPEVLSAIALTATVEQATHDPDEWSEGVKGCLRRYTATWGAVAVNETLTAGFEVALHEDPRYYPLDGFPAKKRIWNAVKQTFITQTDQGVSSFAYGRVAGAFATGQLSRTWLPASQNSLGDGFRTGGISIGISAAVNLIYEFIPSTRPK